MDEPQGAQSPLPEDYSALLTTEEERAVAARILPALARRANELAEARKAKELEREVNLLRDQNRELIEKEIDRMREETKPPSPEELEKLLSQEYLRFTVRLAVNGTDKEFVIREMPQAAEMRFVRVLQKSLVPKLRELSAFQWAGAQATTEEQIQRIVDFVPEVLDLSSELCALALDPKSEDGIINAAWVRDNLSTFRIGNIVTAQLMASRIRDFFSLVSRSLPGRTIM